MVNFNIDHALTIALVIGWFHGKHIIILAFRAYFGLDVDVQALTFNGYACIKQIIIHYQHFKSTKHPILIRVGIILLYCLSVKKSQQILTY
jgi:hypothetical protein